MKNEILKSINTQSVHADKRIFDAWQDSFRALRASFFKSLKRNSKS
ncbi:MAG: hypothetical protein WCK42_05265 [Myxococcaceae bacterium]